MKKSTLFLIISLLLVILQFYFLIVGILSSNIPMILISTITFLLMLFLISSLISKYNTMIRYKNKIKESLSLIDIHLKLRFDLIPNLVETVKGYSKHENDVFNKIIEKRNAGVNAIDEKQKIESANETLPYLRSIIAISESYLDLKSQPLYKSLMTELTSIEDKLVASRRIYDSNVNLYNNLIETFPNSIIASLFNFEKSELFKIDSGESITNNISFN